VKFNWGTVTGVNPLRITLDGDTEPIPFTPDSLIDPLTLVLADRVRTELSGHRLIVLGRVGGLGLVSGRNLLINGDFRINQREYASGATTAANGYTLDRWYTRLATGTFQFSAAPQGQPVTIGTSGVERYFAQVIERANFQPGTHVVSWEGAAKGAIFAKGGSAVSYNSSPFIFESSGTVDTVLEFAGEADTVWNVKVERGTVPTPFSTAPIGQELALCQRYYYNPLLDITNVHALLGQGTADSTTSARIPFPLSVPMRATPTLVTSGAFGLYNGTTTAVTSIILSSWSTSAVPVLYVTVASGLTANRSYLFKRDLYPFSM